jgi:hypothetical protein
MEAHHPQRAWRRAHTKRLKKELLMSLFTQKELQKYSVTKALAEISDQPAPGFHAEGSTGLEREVHETAGGCQPCA